MTLQQSTLFALIFGVVLVSATSVDRVCQCSINGQCFSPQQVALYNIDRCYQLACLPTTTGTRMAMQHVGPCGQCCEHGGSLVASGQTVVDQEQGCTITCNGGNSWSSCGGGGGGSSGGSSGGSTGGNTGEGTIGGTGGGNAGDTTGSTGGGNGGVTAGGTAGGNRASDGTNAGTTA